MHRDDFVMFCYCDVAGQVRGKGFPAKDLDARMTRGIGWTPTNILISAFGPIASSPFGSWGDLILMPDPATRVEVDFGDGSPPEHFYLSDVLNTDCTPWECCPRTFLKRALAALETETGHQVVASLEQEFFYGGAGGKRVFLLQPELGAPARRIRRSAAPRAADGQRRRRFLPAGIRRPPIRGHVPARARRTCRRSRPDRARDRPGDGPSPRPPGVLRAHGRERRHRQRRPYPHESSRRRWPSR